MRSAFMTAALAAIATPAIAQEPSQPVEIRFAARVGDQSATCSVAYSGIGSAAAGLRLQDMRIYVSQVRLLDDAGNAVPVTLTADGQWQSDQVALLDFEDRSGNCNGNAATNMVVRGTVPQGHYSGLVFDIGVPFAVNHQDPTLADAPLNFTALTWPWRFGYKFITIDLETSGGAGGPNAATGFSIHLGSTACEPGPIMSAPNMPCANGNRPTYRLEQFDPATNTVVLDLAALLADTDITVNQPETASGCMSSDQDADCFALMDRLGLDFAGHASAGQQWVRVE